KPPPSTATAPARDSVFLASVADELREHREAVRQVIAQLHLQCLVLDPPSAPARSPLGLIRPRMEATQVFLGILGVGYGLTDPMTGLSTTELEYRQALTAGKELRMFVLDEHAPIEAGMVEHDAERHQKLQEFRARVREQRHCVMFTDVADLVAKVRPVLAALRPREEPRTELRIEIDRADLEQAVADIVETDFFRELQKGAARRV